MIKNVKVGGGEAQGSVEEEGRWSSFRRRQWRQPEAAATAAAVQLHDGDTGPRQGEAVSAAGTAAARGGAAAAAEAAVGLLP